MAPRWLSEKPASPRLTKLKIFFIILVVIAVFEVIFSSSSGREHFKDFTTSVSGSFSDATSFLHGPKKPKYLDDAEHPCGEVSQDQLAQLQRLQHLSVYAYNGGFPVSDTFKMEPGSSVCIIVAVPQTPLDVYKDGPVDGKGPDNIHLYINSSSVRISLPPPRPIPGQAGLKEIFLDRTMLYHTELKLYDEGAYQINVDLEWTNWQWANQWTDDFEHGVTHYSTGLDIPFPDPNARQQEINTFHEAHVVAMPRDRSFPHYINIVSDSSRQELEKIRSKRPICSDKISANEGRWYFSNAHPVQSGLVDEWGFAWEGDHCRLDFFTEQDEMDCFADKQIHAFGDSNLRRFSKALMSGGRACRNLTDKCQGEDTYSPILKLVQIPNTHLLMEAIETKYDKWTMSDHEFRQFDFGFNTSMHFGFQRAVTVNYQDWTKRFYDLSALPEDQAAWGINPDERFLPTFKPGIDLKAGSKARRPPGTETPDLVIIGFGAWDEAYAPTFEDFERTLPYYRDALMEAYPNIPMVLRLSHGHCCPQVYNLYRHNSGVRIQHMNDIMKRVFQVNEQGTHGMDGKIVVIDTERLVGRPEDIIDYGEVLSNHIRFSRIRTELQMFLNSVCERDPRTGRARMRRREWQGMGSTAKTVAIRPGTFPANDEER